MSALVLPARETVGAYSGLARLRTATPEEQTLFLAREHQPRAFAFLDRGWPAERAAAFVEECTIGGVHFRVEVDDIGDPAADYMRTTGLLPD